ncbi:MAG: succinate dehydrogenase iron-sulfur subunit [Phycisphaeraceae bacterium]|nr:succinate dehydrogenase iron-sulfur subunit [Phycisphaeraceae bacterium]
MTASDAKKNFYIKVKRQDGPGKNPYYQTFELPYKPNLNIISCLQAIASNPVTIDGKQVAPVVWDCSCLEEVCGACTMVMGGKVGQSCSTLVDELMERDGTGSKANPITLEPMSKFPVVRDLFVDRASMFNNLKDIKGWVPIDGTHHLGGGPRESQEEQDLRYALSRCMTCGCCLEACPQFSLEGNFVGAQVFGQTLYFNMHETGATLKDDRLNVMQQAGGISDCGNAQNCVEVCPKELPLVEAIAKIGRQTTVHSVKQFFTGKK